MKKTNSSELLFSPEQILEKHFSVVLKGYSPIEVDDFLDKIIEDYRTFYSLITEYEKELFILKDKLNKSLIEHKKLSEENEILAHNQEKIESEKFDNLNLIKRVSRLEKLISKNSNLFDDEEDN
ncbi:DivIVA domain-containing protein [symbiont of Argiope bruennichi]|uniref:DivIVA domain-containing protein n=1 Tax=symbiont of Argiope bruennichi TaxID=2810479 RepID=UPI003DA324C2